MKTLEKGKEAKLDGRTLEAQIASWYRPPTLKTVLTQELAHEIAECFLDGFNDEETAEMCNVSLPTLKNWRNLSVIRNHERSRKKFYIHEIRDGKRRDWTRLAWWLERRYPLEFSRPEVAHAISTSIHTTVNTTQNLIVSSELAEALAERNAKIAGKIEQLFANRPNAPHPKQNIKDVMCYNDGQLEGVQQVKDIVNSITDSNAVAASSEPSKSEILDPPFVDPAGGTPLVGAGAPTDALSPTRPQKTEHKTEKGFEVIPDFKGDSEKSAAAERKKFDLETKKSLVRATELEGQVRKEKIKNIISEAEKKELRGKAIEEIQARRMATKVNRAALTKANHEADKTNPRRARR